MSILFVFVIIIESFILKLVIYQFYFVMTNSKGSFGDRIANKLAFCVLNDYRFKDCILCPFKLMNHRIYLSYL